MYRPGFGSGLVEVEPAYGGIDERPRVAELPDLSGLISSAEEADRRARLFLDLFLGSMGNNERVAQQFPMSQEEFQFEVHKRMDRNKPSVQDVLRDKFGVGSFREGINKGIFPGAPQLPGV